MTTEGAAAPPTSSPAEALAPTDAESLRCRAKGCRATATWALRWNNPSLHRPERRKVWLACEAHRASLSNFLHVRGFLRGVVAVSELRDTDG